MTDPLDAPVATACSSENSHSATGPHKQIVAATPALMGLQMICTADDRVLISTSRHLRIILNKPAETTPEA